MLYALLGLLFLVLAYGPTAWVRYVLWRHSKEIDDMPGSGGELAQHLIERFELSGVKVEEGLPFQDHYNPETQVVSLSPNVYNGKSLTAVAVAAHEIGHAIQFTRDEPVSRLRRKYMGRAVAIKKLGFTVLACAPVGAVVAKTPLVMGLFIGAAVATMLASVLMYAAILPEEYDASFNKALPTLDSGYVPQQHMPAVRQVLQAAALTYVAAALAEVLSLWRWFRVFR